MKKVNVLLIGILVCIAYYFYFSEYIEKENKRYEEEQGKLLLHIQPDSITGISGTLEDTHFDMIKNNGSWGMALPVLDEVNPDVVEEILHIIAEMKYESYFVPDDGDYLIFELQNPHYIWKLREKTGKEHILKIGDVNIMGSKGYARIDDKPEVYLISLSDRNSLRKQINDFREKVVYKGNSNELNQIEIKRKKGVILLTKKGDTWGLGEDGFPVNNELIRKITEGLTSLKIQSFVSEDLDSQETYLPEKQTIIFSSGENTLSIIVENTPEKPERYAIIGEKERIVTLSGKYIENFEYDVDTFREKKLFRLFVHQATLLTLERGGEKLELEERENSWFLNKTLKANSGKVYDLLKSFIALEIIDFKKTLRAEDLQKVASITLGAQGQEPKTVVIYEALFQANEFYVSTPNGSIFYQINLKNSQDILVTASDLEDRKIFPFDAQEINSILVRHTGKNDLEFQRNDNIWNGKKGEKKELIDFLWTLQEIAWLQKNITLPSNVTIKSELELSGTSEKLQIQLYKEGFCVVNGKKYEISRGDIGKITDFLDNLY